MKHQRKSTVWSRLCLLPVLLALLASPARAVDLGLTPSHVYALWMNINAALITVAGATSDDERLSRRLEAMEPRTFQGKEPADVLKQLVIFGGKLDRLRYRYGLKDTRNHKYPVDTKVTPRVVFLHSGHVLDSVVLLLIRIDKTHMISGYFRRRDISGKTPNDPYSLIDLSNRRMDVLLRQ